METFMSSFGDLRTSIEAIFPANPNPEQNIYF